MKPRGVRVSVLLIFMTIFIRLRKVIYTLKSLSTLRQCAHVAHG